MEPIKVLKPAVDAIVDQLTYDHHHYLGTNYVVAIAKDAFGYVHAHGFSSCIDPAAFDLQQGIDIATRNAKAAAVNAIWEKESYKLLDQVKERRRTQITLDLGENHPDPQGATGSVLQTVMSDGSVFPPPAASTPATEAQQIATSFANMRNHGAPVVNQHAHQVVRDGLITSERRVWPWWRSDRDNKLFNMAARPARGGMTAPLVVNDGAMNLKDLCGTDQAVMVNTVERLYIAMDNYWFAVDVSSKAPGNNVVPQTPDYNKHRLSMSFKTGIYTGTEFHDASNNIIQVDIGKDAVEFVVSLEVVNNVADGRLVVMAYIDDPRVVHKSDGWNPQGAVVEQYFQKFKELGRVKVVGIDLYTTILESVLPAATVSALSNTEATNGQA